MEKQDSQLGTLPPGIGDEHRLPSTAVEIIAAISYAIFGAVAGGLSLWLLPDLFIEARWLRLANVIITPIAAGIVMAWIGAWRQRQEKTVIRLESFAYGMCFALAMALVRFFWGH